jgi:hypothetical protein
MAAPMTVSVSPEALVKSACMGETNLTGGNGDNGEIFLCFLSCLMFNLIAQQPQTL